MSKLLDIIDGWTNLIFKSEEHEKIAENRMAECINCDQLTNLNRCKQCGCYMPAKVRNETSTCPLKKW
jgi:hypothetical protein